MKARDLRKDLYGRGVDVRRNGQKLIVDAPTGALTIVDRDLLRQLKPDLLAILNANLTPDERVQEIKKPIDETRQASRKPWNPTPEDEATICRAIEKDKGLPPGSIRLYTPAEYLRLF